MERTVTLQSILDDLKDYVEYQREEGVNTVEMSREVLEGACERGKGGMGEGERITQRRGACQAEGMGAEEREGESDMSLESIAKQVKSCEKCSLHETRTNAVPGQGSSSPEIMFIGEAPGADEDKQGFAFVGRAGKLLTKMIEAMGYTRDEVFIGNILKCRPPNNRPPLPDEMETCMPYLKEQIKQLKPKVIIALGATSVKGLMDTQIGISKLRGNWMSFEGIDLMPTYHPAYLLRNPKAKHDVWADLQIVLKHLGRTAPPVKK